MLRVQVSKLPTVSMSSNFACGHVYNAFENWISDFSEVEEVLERLVSWVNEPLKLDSD